ncbi:bifunctional diaminohydroxyphosphoribosylaminopyrimidine deaminase/5-amino-6-(5-phosphoribosylamino)uracil reductase RibD [Nitrococcus mobilis]|uniref:Riboflavin biosynthesis protein RibD n=1 Tax=Nitrococcus mobilis Nb-231 TaxID=314278 RepID=A4BNJ8_9GAMM|nr:riboflavin biosynthesis protein RibD [Nitrococcus mobilis Nb-231]
MRRRDEVTDFTAADRQYMAHALRLAKRGLFSTGPNPRVGCVIVRNGQLVGEGWHRRAGEPHAEINALAAAGQAARGAILYVTLEPCCHHGRTPPCTTALLSAGITRVIAACKDPNPRVAGQGLEQLTAAGITTRHGLMAEQAQTLNPGFFKRMRTGLPYVRCKLAMSLDGRTAMASGESRWITAAAARGDVHRLRARSDGLLTGHGTVLADDPQLTARDVDTSWDLVQPCRLVLDSRLRIPKQARMLQEPGKVAVLYAHHDRRRAQDLTAAGAELWPIEPDSDGRVELRQALTAIGNAEINELLVEAGPTLSGALLQADLIDELVVYIAPHLMGDEARPLLRLPGLVRMAERIPITITDMRALGPDLRLTARLEKG